MGSNPIGKSVWVLYINLAIQKQNLLLSLDLILRQAKSLKIECNNKIVQNNLCFNEETMHGKLMKKGICVYFKLGFYS